MTWNLLFYGQDREQNFTKFFTELCASVALHLSQGLNRAVAEIINYP